MIMMKSVSLQIRNLRKNDSKEHIDSLIVKGTFNENGGFDIQTTISGLKEAMQHVMKEQRVHLAAKPMRREKRKFKISMK